MDSRHLLEVQNHRVIHLPEVENRGQCSGFIIRCTISDAVMLDLSPMIAAGIRPRRPRQWLRSLLLARAIKIIGIDRPRREDASRGRCDDRGAWSPAALTAAAAATRDRERSEFFYSAALGARAHAPIAPDLVTSTPATVGAAGWPRLTRRCRRSSLPGPGARARIAAIDLEAWTQPADAGRSWWAVRTRSWRSRRPVRGRGVDRWRPGSGRITLLASTRSPPGELGLRAVVVNIRPWRSRRPVRGPHCLVDRC